ncbi:hypothetical protein LXH09_35450 [Streptomyces sp. CS7]|uniref:hypothetical protein n=1 Tax=Streptomyces sp. CS-7 TaxID=2906769 RepID=UPI0021B2BD08|nr:hypothetical protein [Streptomyces sp. CS-7]MCT6781932.1 hypothetical protein [Streptomyces sp. CS-7]
MSKPKKKALGLAYSLPVPLSAMAAIEEAIGSGTPVSRLLGRQAAKSVLNIGVGATSGTAILRATGAYQNPLSDLIFPGVAAIKRDLFGSVAGIPGSAALRAAAGTHPRPILGMTTTINAFKRDIFSSAAGIPISAAIRAPAYPNPFADLKLKHSVNLGTPLGADYSAFTRRIADRVTKRASELADLLFPPNLQGFTKDEWDRLITLCTDDGVGMMFAPSTDHLHALLKAPDRAARYAYLMAHREAVLDEISDGLKSIEHEELQDLTGLAQAAVECAAAGHWEGALSIAANVSNTAVEQYAIDWYRKEFQGVRDARNTPITGVKGPGATLRYVADIPLPERKVGVFELRAHLTVRPLSSAFQKTGDRADTDIFNRNAVAHLSSYDSYREEFTLPVLLTMHSLLRGLNENLLESRSTV